MSVRKPSSLTWSLPSSGGAPMRRLIRRLAQWAVASSMAAGCGSHHIAEQGQGPKAAGSAGSRVEGRAGMPAYAGRPGTAGATGEAGLGGTTGEAGTTGGAAGMAGANARAGSVAPEPPPVPEPLCVGPGAWFLGDVDLRDGDDYAWLNMNGFLIEEVGTECARAMDSRTCLTRLAEIRGRFPNSIMPSAPDNPLVVPGLVTTRGDDVAYYSGREALIDYFRPIDRIGEAKLLLWLNGRALPHCTSGPATQARIVRVDGGFEIEGGSPHCMVQPLEKIDEQGNVTIVRNANNCAVDGRRPPGFELTAPRAANGALGAHFARAAQFEAASVHAFARLAGELEALGAPAQLIAAARRAVREEARHAQQMSACARRFGADAGAPIVHPSPARSAFEIALDNALEGCVGETYAALMASHQALAAQDPAVRFTMASIARDEASHADFSWALAHWLEPRLPARERALIDAARHDALERLTSLEVGAELDPRERAAAGLPEPALARSLAERLRDGLHAARFASAS